MAPSPASASATVALVFSTDGFNPLGMRALMGIHRYLVQHPSVSVRSGILGPLMTVAQVAEHNVRAIIGQFYADPVVQKTLQARRRRVINVSNLSPESVFPRVISDDVACGRLAAEHLLGLGYHTLGFIPMYEHRYSNQRGAGFRRAVEQAGLTCHIPALPNQTSSELQMPVLREFMRQLPRPFALATANDIRARHVINTASSIGLHIPNDFVIVGCDNDPLQGVLSNMPMSSVQPNFELVGYRAMELMGRWLHEGIAPPAETLIPPVGVIARQTTRGVPTTHPDVLAAIAYMRQHLGNLKLSIAAVAEATAQSRRSLEYRFDTQLGHGPGYMLMQIRLHRARDLLTSTHLAIFQISATCGFSDEAVFSRAFKHHVQMTPRDYRRLYTPGVW
ncbi:MAG: substrate-binding domain-containing protein [Phycisphaerae bacterium]